MAFDAAAYLKSKRQEAVTGSNPLTASSVTEEKKEKKNKGGVLGGIGYTAGNLLTGIFGVGEGVYDFVVGGVADLFGADEYAERLHKDDVTGRWQQGLDEWYNPSKAMDFVGDVAGGLGQTATYVGLNLIPVVGQWASAGAMFGSAAGRGITSAYQKTGKLGGKEYLYGMGSGAMELALETATGGVGKIAGAIKGSSKTVAKSAVRSGILRTMWDTGKGEFVEEAVSEFLDPYLQRATIDPTAKNATPMEIFRSGMVGFVSGAIGGAAGTGMGNVRSLQTGNKIVKEGTESITVRGNNKVGDLVVQTGSQNTVLTRANTLLSTIDNNQNGKSVAGNLLALKGSVDAYNALKNKDGVRGKMLLGEIARNIAYTEVSQGVEASKTNITQKADILAQYFTNNKGQAITADDIRNNKDGILTDLAIADFSAKALMDNEAALSLVKEGEAGILTMPSQFETWRNSLDQEQLQEGSEALGIDLAAANFKQFIDAMGEFSTKKQERDAQRQIQREYVSAKSKAEYKEGVRQEKATQKWQEGVQAANVYEVSELGEVRKKLPLLPERVSLKKGDSAIYRAENGLIVGIKREGDSYRVGFDNAEGKGIGLTNKVVSESQLQDVLTSIRGLSAENVSKMQIKEAKSVATTEAKATTTETTQAKTESKVKEVKAKVSTAALTEQARSLVKDFDNLPANTKARIREMLESAKGYSKISKQDLEFVTSLMAMRKGVHVTFADMGDNGVYISKNTGERFIQLNGNNPSEAVRSASIHEFGHDLTKSVGYSIVAKNAREFVPDKAIEVWKQEYRDYYEKLGKEIKDTVLEEEVNSRALEAVLNKKSFWERHLNTETTPFIERAKNLAHSFALKFKGVYDPATRAYLKLEKMFDAVLASPAVGKGDAEKLSLSSMSVTFFGKETPNIADFESRKYKGREEYKAYVEQCVNNMSQAQGEAFNRLEAIKYVKASIDGIVDVAVAMKKAGYDIIDTKETRDKKDSKGRSLFSSLEPNSDYITSSDISTICDKRKNFSEIHDDIVRRENELGVPTGKGFFDDINNYFYLHDIMAKKGLTTPCRECYVESMRKNLAPMGAAFISIVTESNPLNTDNKQLWAKAKSGDEIYIVGADGKRYVKKTTNTAIRENVLKALEEHPEYGMSISDLTQEMLTTEDGLTKLRIQAPLIYEYFNSFYGQAKPKMPRKATPFRFGELTAMLTNHNGTIKTNLVDQIKSTGGFRFQSYSDFQIENFADVLQVLFEAGTLGLNGHAYTKVPAFLDATENTNLKRNISIFMYNDGGTWKLDKNDSFPYDLNEIYDIVKGDKSGDTGIIAVVQNEDMAAYVMANENIGYFIPFHKSGIKMGVVRDTVVKEGGRKIKGYSNIKDHTKQQSEVWAKTEDGHKAFTKVKKGIDIYKFWDFSNKEGLSQKKLIEKNVKAYIDACNENGYIPKFREYVMNNGKILNSVLAYSKELGFVSQDATIDDISFEYSGYRIPYGYYKCLGDFGMFKPNGDASPVKPLSLKNYNFAKAVNFFSDANSVRRNEILQQIANGEERERIRNSKMSTAEIYEYVKNLRKSVVEDVIKDTHKIADTERLSLSQGEESAIYVLDGKTKNGKDVNFIDLILDGKKLGETRGHKNLVKNKWVGLAKNGYVYGRVILGNPKEITKTSAEYKDAYISGTNYDIVEDGKKYYYPILEKQDFRNNPIPLSREGNYGVYVPPTDTTRLSIPTKADAEYLAAVKRNDMKTAQKMVDEAAEKWGAIAKENKRNIYRPQHLYHGSGYFGFTRFNKGFIFATVEPSVAAGYNRGKGYGKIRNASLKYIPNDGTEDTVIKNARNILDMEFTVFDEKAKQNILSKSNEIFEKINIKISNLDDNLDYKKGAKLWEYLTQKYGEEYSLKMSNTLDNLHYLLCVEDAEYLIDSRAEWFANDVKKSSEWKQDLNDLRNKEMQAIKEYGYSELFSYLLGWEYGDAIIDIEFGLARMFDKKPKLQNRNGSLIYLDDVIDAIEQVKDVGVYDLYGNSGANPLIIDEGKHFWDAIPFNGGFKSTDYIVKWAKENGYTSVLFKSILDPSIGGSANIYADEWVFFDPNQIKSADPVTYDDNGNVIPLSERFKSENDDIRYSIAYATTGKTNIAMTTKEDKRALRERLREAYQWTRINFVDTQAGIADEFKRLGVDSGEALIQAARSATSKAQHAIGGNIVDITEFSKNGKQPKVLAKGVAKLMQPIEKAGLEAEFFDYLFNLHNIDRLKVDKPVNGNTAEESQQAIKEAEKAHPEFIEWQKEWAQMVDALMTLRLKAGLITQELYDELKARYPHYVPTFREEGKSSGTAGDILGKYDLSVKRTIKNAKGSTDTLLRPDEVIARQTLELYRAIQVNNLLNALYDAAVSKGSTNLEIVSREKMRTSLNKEATDSVVDLETIGDDKPNSATNTVTFFKDGEKITLRVSKNIFTGLDALHPGSMAMDEGFVLKGMRKVMNAFKSGVTNYNPFFLVRNAARDIQDAVIYTKNGAKFAKAYPKAYEEMIKNGELLQLYVAAGGMSSSVFDSHKGFVGSLSKRGFAEVEGNIGKKVLQKIDTANLIVEQLPRFTEFIASIEAGKSVDQAILDSADVTVNFGRSGKITKWLNSYIIPFLNAAVQGASKTFRTFTGRKTLQEWSSLVVRCAILGIAPAVLSSLMYDDDEEYQNLRTEDKENYYLLKVGDKFLKLPRGRIAALLSGVVVRGDLAMKGEEDAFKGLGKSALETLTPVESASRSIFSPFADVKNNVTWYGTAIEGREFDNKAVKDRYDEGTSSIAIALGKTKIMQELNMSPKKIHYLIDQYAGVLGDVFLPMTTKKAERTPLASNFTVDPITNNKLSTKFYKIYDETTYASSAGDSTAALKLRHFNKVKQGISDLYKQKDEIQASKLSDKEKLARTRIIQTLINEAYKTAIDESELWAKAFADSEGLGINYSVVEVTKSNYKKLEESKETIGSFVIAYNGKTTGKTYETEEKATKGLSSMISDFRFAEGYRLMGGTEQALAAYNTAAYEKAQKLNAAGIDYDSYYTAYMTLKQYSGDASEKREYAVSTIASLDLTKQQRLMLIYALGYTVKDGELWGLTSKAAKTNIARYIRSLKISNEEKITLAKACGLTVKNGKIVTK